MQMVTAVGKTWHPEHFVCVHCGEALSSCNYFERDLEPYCERDYYRLFSPKCETCAGPVLDVSFIEFSFSFCLDRSSGIQPVKVTFDIS